MRVKPRVVHDWTSPNSSLRTGAPISYIVLHYTASSTAVSAINHFRDEDSRVSAHYIIDKNGEIYQMVSDQFKAWHVKSVNDFSIGIEFVAKAGEQITKEQDKAATDLISWLIQEYAIPLKNIIGHNQVPDCKTDCPNALFGEKRSPKDLARWVYSRFSLLPKLNLEQWGYELAKIAFRIGISKMLRETGMSPKDASYLIETFVADRAASRLYESCTTIYHMKEPVRWLTEIHNERKSQLERSS